MNGAPQMRKLPTLPERQKEAHPNQDTRNHAKDQLKIDAHDPAEKPLPGAGGRLFGMGSLEIDDGNSIQTRFFSMPLRRPIPSRALNISLLSHLNVVWC